MAKIRTAAQYLKEEMDIEMPKGIIDGSWFTKNYLPMVVQCANCGMTMTLPSAMVDENGIIYCSSCAENP